MRYGESLMKLAQTVSVQRSFELNAVLAWRLSEAQSYVDSQAWKDSVENEQNRYQFLADLVKSINQTISVGANAIIKTIATRFF